jgi:hypothetical protein
MLYFLFTMNLIIIFNDVNRREKNEREKNTKLPQTTTQIQQLLYKSYLRSRTFTGDDKWLLAVTRKLKLKTVAVTKKTFGMKIIGTSFTPSP